jgi:hypothetical protein
MTDTQHTKQFCLNGGVVSASLDDENEVRYLFSDDELDAEDRLLISLELQELINKASFIPADPHAYIKYIATKCGCCDDILLLKHETLVIA